MINNWNDYRNKDIEYYGTRSIYYDYEKVIEKMVNEDNKINKELYDIQFKFLLLKFIENNLNNKEIIE